MFVDPTAGRVHGPDSPTSNELPNADAVLSTGRETRRVSLQSNSESEGDKGGSGWPSGDMEPSSEVHTSAVLHEPKGALYKKITMGRISTDRIG